MRSKLVLGTLVYDELILPILRIRLHDRALLLLADASHLEPGTFIGGTFQLFGDDGLPIIETRPQIGVSFPDGTVERRYVIQRIELDDL
jgi:hypothetical protein